MSQIWCVECNAFVSLERGHCSLCNRVVKGYVPVETGSSSPKKIVIDHVRIIDSSDVANMLGQRTEKVTNMASSGEIPAVISGGVWVFDRSIIQEWMLRGRPTARKAREMYARARGLGLSG